MTVLPPPDLYLSARGRGEGRAGLRSGRRPGESGAREAILEAARESFAARGFDRATIREIATGAGVDPALVIHYFGSKGRLFGEALELPIAPNEILKAALAADPGRVGASVVRAFLSAWEPLETRRRLVAMVRSAMTNDVAMSMVRAYLSQRVLAPITQTLGVTDADLRASLVGSQLYGLSLMRYVMRIEPIASAPVEQLVAAIGPTVQRYLTGDLERA